MGNRGVLHDEHGRIMQSYEIRRWIYCRLQFKGRKREIMQPGSYTELFFLDEATALAAGHRPCAECMRERYDVFRRAWLRGNGGASARGLPKATELDAQLHRDRLSKRVKRTYRCVLSDLPVGTFVRADPDGMPHLLVGDSLARWSPEGYAPRDSVDPALEVEVLTPSSSVAAIKAGFPPAIHESVSACGSTVVSAQLDLLRQR
jgi:hypothetical protein